jgi:hypothetical protein
MNSDGFNSNTSFRDGITTDLIKDDSDISAIEIDATTINFDCFNLTHNGLSIPTGASAVSNPMTSTLDANNQNITNLNIIRANQITSPDEAQYIDLDTSGEISISAVSKTRINSNDVLLNTIRDFTETSYIAMNSANIELNSASVTINANNVLTTPLQEDIDANSKKIINVDRMTVSSISDYSEQRVIDFATAGEIQIYASQKTTINSDEVLLNSIKDYTSTSSITFTTSDEISLSAPDNINLNAPRVKINSGEVLVKSIIDYDNQTTYIDFTTLDEISLAAPTNINLDAPTVRINARNILTTPIQEDVDANLFNIVNVNQLTTDTIGSPDLTRFIAFTTPNEIAITAPTSISLDTINILQNSRTKQLVDIHSNNNTYAGLNSAVGTQYCTSYGNLAGSSSSGTYNTAIGYNTMPTATIFAVFNTAIGAESLLNLTDGDSNTGCGFFTLRNNTNGDQNTAIGRNSGFGYTTGSNNISVGVNSNDSTADNGGCNQCIAIGNSTRTNGNTTNSIVIGHSVASTISNECIIGNSSCTILRNAGIVCDLGTSANKFKDLYLSGNMGINGHTITPNGGLYLSTSSGPTITGLGVVNLLNGVSSVGSLAFASGFPEVSGYRMRLSTTLNGVGGDKLFLYFNLGGILILSLNVNLSSGLNKAGILELEFYVTTLSLTVGVVNMFASYQYDDTGTVKGDTSSTLYSTLDTTAAQPLTITAAFNTAAAGNSIQCFRAMLNKIY